MLWHRYPPDWHPLCPITFAVINSAMWGGVGSGGTVGLAIAAAFIQRFCLFFQGDLQQLVLVVISAGRGELFPAAKPGVVSSHFSHPDLEPRVKTRLSCR